METSEEMGPSVFMIILLLLSQSVHCQEESVLQCIADKNKCITCMWNQQGTPKENYTMYYRILNFESQPALPCRNYLQDGQINIGCWINATTVNLFSPFVVQLNSTNRDKPIILEYKRMQTMVKLDPPYNLTIKATNHSELLLQWQFDHGDFPVLCICFQVEHQNMASKEGKVKEVRSALFSLPSYDPKQIYTFRVRNKLCEICADAKMWSEWSEEITWGKNETLIVEASIVQSLVISLMSSVLLLVLLFLLIRMERIWVILVPRIPNPGKNFEDLIKIHKGDFQEWLGISKEAVESFKHNYTETLCSVSEDPMDPQNRTCLIKEKRKEGCSNTYPVS